MTDLVVNDKEYLDWLQVLTTRYRQSQIKAAIKVNSEQLMYNWLLGRDIVEMHIEERWGEGVIMQLSRDLRAAMPGIEGFSKTNIYYCKKFYLLYNQDNTKFPQVGGKLESLSTEKFPQVGGIFQIPWKHHCFLMDKCGNDTEKALFYVHKTIEYGWSRAMLMNFYSTNLYERDGRAISNFQQALPAEYSDLAQEITRDPYNFAFADIRGKYNERQLKQAMLHNITDFLLELGTGFAYVGKEYRLQIGETENFIDLLFYHLELRCYVVVEVKVDKFTAGDLGQLSTYVVACNHLLKRKEDNPTIGLLICKDKDDTVAQYSLEGTNQPVAISSYELEKLYPTKVDGLIPSIEDIEHRLNENN